MALDINTGYNETFKAFADFAAKSAEAGKTRAVARVGGELARRTITAAKSDWVGVGVGRLYSLKDANNVARDLFRKAIIDMFGGDKNIPPSVQDAMKLADYDKGKPLTARRILAVKAAIDLDGTAKARAEKIDLETFKSHDAEPIARHIGYTDANLPNLARAVHTYAKKENVTEMDALDAFIELETFKSPEARTAALDMGYAKTELPKLARAAHLYAQAEGKSEMDALREVATPGTKANRLMNYGGRFLEDASKFTDGLRLLDDFTAWFSAVRDTKNKDADTLDNARSVTDLNIQSTVVKADSTAAMERFVFEELALNPDANLTETDPEKIFGMKDNAAMRFFGTYRYGNFAGVVASVPPERRGAIFAVFDKLSKPIPETKEDAKAFYAQSSSELGVRHPSLVIGRILRHLPEIENLMAKDELTESNIVKTLFPDMPSPDWTLKGLNEYTHEVDRLAVQMLVDGGMDEEDATDNGRNVQLVMEETCCTLKEACDSFTTGKRVAPPPYMTTVTFAIEKFDGTTKEARKLLDGNKDGDLWRAYNYTPVDAPNTPGKAFIKDETKQAFGFKFPDGTFLRANAGAHQGNIPTIIDKLEALAGKVHPRQQTALMFAVSQAGTGMLKGGLTAFGIYSTEHACVDFTLSKDENTGAITVKYTSPEDLPIHFSWTATIDVDGNMTTTPMVVDKIAERLDAKTARAMVEERAKALDVNLTGAQKREAVQYLQTYGTNMYGKNARLFAGFAVQLVRTHGTAEKKAKIAADTAKSIREWRDFDFGDPRNVAFKNAVRDFASETIREHMQPDKADKFTDNIHETMIKDILRGVYILNGTTFSYYSAEDVVPVFKTLVPDAKKQKALSTYLNQLCLTTTFLPSNHVPYDSGTEAYKLKGADMLANRDMSTGLYSLAILDTVGYPITYDLQVSPDGKMATITHTITGELAAPGEVNGITGHFGKVTLSQRLVINLEPDIPVVTDFQLSQSIDV